MTEFPDWFSAYAKPNFERFLRLQGRQTRMECLQLGAYTGDASVWMLNNLGEIELTDVDTWEGSDEEAHKSIDFDEVYNIYCNKVERFNNVSHFRTTTQEFLINKRNRSYSFDFIYIDADHTAAGVLLDAELSWDLLKVGGIMAFDDYEWGAHLPASKSPKLGIDLFLERHAGEYELLESGLQVWIRKV